VRITWTTRVHPAAIIVTMKKARMTIAGTQLL
jgi:hypothetical protein